MSRHNNYNNKAEHLTDRPNCFMEDMTNENGNILYYQIHGHTSTPNSSSLFCSTQEVKIVKHSGKALVLGIFMLAFVGSSLAYAQSFSPAPNTPNFTAQKPQQAGAVATGKRAFAPNRLIVKFKATSTPPASGAPPGAQAPIVLSTAAVSALNSIQGQAVRSLGNIGAHVVETKQNLGKAIDALYRSGTVEFVEPDYQVHAIAVPNDPDFGLLWGLDNSGQTGGIPDADIDAPEAWNIRKATDNKTVITVLDTGVDYTHPDLAPNMWKNPKEIAGNYIDDDGNGWVDDVYGADFYWYDADPMDDYLGIYHGTHVSGTIGAQGNNGVGVTGVAWNTKIMALKFLDPYGYGYTSDAIAAMDYAAKIKVINNYRMIINNSWGGDSYSQALYNEIDYLRGLGILFTAAAGNDNRNTDPSPVYPAGYNLPNVISVGASDAWDNRAYFSNYGCNSVEVYAPGVDIYSTMAYGGYQYLSGTSMATSHVSAMLGLVWSQNPTAGWRKIKSAVLNSVDQVPTLSQQGVSQGRANLFKALQTVAMTEPTVWKISPAPSAPGTNITITGQNFGTITGSLAINGSPLTVVSWADTVIKATIPTDTSFGTGTLKVTRSDGNLSDIGACVEVSYKPALIGQTYIQRAWASGARVGANFWIFGGETPAGVTSLVEKITLPAGTWTISNAWMMPTPLSNTGAAAIGSKIYVVGGYDPYTGSISNKLQIFNTTNGKWTVGALLPQPLLQPSVAAVGGKLYVFGGISQFLSSTGSTYIYDPTTNSWVTGTDKPTPVGYATATVASNGSSVVKVSGGFNSPYYGYETNVVEEYNTATDTWTFHSNMNHLRGGAAAAYYKGKDQVVFGSLLNTTGEWWDGLAWVDAITGGQQLYTGMGTTDNLGNNMFVIDGFDQSIYWYSSNIWRIRE